MASQCLTERGYVPRGLLTRRGATVPALFGRLYFAFGRYRADLAFAPLSLVPDRVVLFGPVLVHGAFPHALERAFLTDGTHVDVKHHAGDDKHGDNAVHDLGNLHRHNTGAVERKHQDISAHYHQATPEHDDPVDRFLTGIEEICGRMLLAKAATLHHPLNVELTRQIPDEP